MNIKFILDHIKKVFCKNNNKLFCFFMCWLAHIIQKPNRKTKICIIMKTKNRKKIFFWKWFCSKIIGINNCILNITTKKMMKYEILKDKILVICKQKKVKNKNLANIIPLIENNSKKY